MAIEQEVRSKIDTHTTITNTFIELLKGVTFWVQADNKFLNIHKDDDRRRAVESIVEGKIVVVNWNGVQGLSCLGSDQEAISKIAYLKQRKLSEHPLIMAAGVFLRQRFIDHTKLPSFMDLIKERMYELPHFFEFPADSRFVPEGIGKNDPEKGRVVAIFDANYNLSLHYLESALYDLVPAGKGFFAGASANRHNIPPARTAKEAHSMFGNSSREISYYLVDVQMERSGTFRGSHPMLGFNKEGNKVVPLRNGVLKIGSFRQIYQDYLEIPSYWKDPDNAKYIDLDSIRIRKSYINI